MKYCLGTVQFGMNYGIQGNGQPSWTSVKSIIDYALSHGIDILDTASAYGDAEELLGNLLDDENLLKTRIISKLPPNAFDSAPINQWDKIAVESAKATLSRLKASHLFAYMFHNASYIFNEDAVRALNTVYENNLSEHIGVSIYTPEEALKALDYDQISVIQIPYNAFDHRLEQNGFFAKAKEKNVIIFARSSLLQGLLVMNPENLPERVRFAQNYLTEYRRICDKYDISPLEASIGYVNCNNYVDYIVFGVDNIEQLETYLKIQDLVLPEEMMSILKDTYKNVEEKLVNPSLWGIK